MKLEPGRLKTFASQLIEHLALLEIEITAAKMMIAGLQVKFKFPLSLEEQLEDLKSQPAVLEIIEQRYALLRTQLEQTFQDQEVLALLESWRPKGKTK